MLPSAFANCSSVSLLNNAYSVGAGKKLSRALQNTNLKNLKIDGDGRYVTELRDRQSVSTKSYLV